MTLLEALVALVILGASAAGVLGVFQTGARSVHSADAWNRATVAAESALEESVRAHIERTPATFSPGGGDGASGTETRVDVQPWRTNVEDIVVRVTLPDGRSMTVHRLVRRR